jgi:hypothetical protein
MHALPNADVFAPDPFLMPDGGAAASPEYLDRCRRVRVGPAVTLVFENRLTLWFRVQELARVARLTAPSLVQRELDWYARLLPGDDRVRAAVWVAEPGRRPTKAVETIRRAVANGRIGFRCGDGHEVVGVTRDDRVNDRLIGLSNWVEFQFDAAELAALADARLEWRVFVEAVGYVHESDPLTTSVRESLLADLSRGE